MNNGASRINLSNEECDSKFVTRKWKIVNDLIMKKIIFWLFFDYKTKILENTVSDGNDGILKYSVIAVSLKNLSSF